MSKDAGRAQEGEEALVRYFVDAIGGSGWYWHDAEYPEAGCCGRFPNVTEAVQSARMNGYTNVTVVAHGDTYTRQPHAAAERGE